MNVQNNMLGFWFGVLVSCVATGCGGAEGTQTQVVPEAGAAAPPASSTAPTPTASTPPAVAPAPTTGSAGGPAMAARPMAAPSAMPTAPAMPTTPRSSGATPSAPTMPGAMSGAAGMPMTPAMEPAAPTEAMDQGMGDGSDVIAIGDSWMAGIAPPLLQVSGQPYRNVSVGGAPLLEETAGTGRNTIVEQYNQAKADNPDIKTVVMTAGGIDVLEGPGGGADGNMALATALKSFFETMAADGVKDVLYYSYSRSQAESIETLYKTQETACAAVPAGLRCHLLDSDTVIMGVLGDGIHPSQQGSMDLAATGYALMMEKGMRR